MQAIFTIMTTLERPPFAPVHAPRERTLAAYLVLPRPGDLGKAVIAPLGFALGAAVAGGVSAGQVGRALVVWVALELLVYQARYQWNDVRGFLADQAHPDRAARGRLPGPVERGRAHRGASLAVAAVRLALAAAVTVVVPGTAGVIAALVVGVFGAALLYEGLRSRATGRTGQVPVPLRPSLVALWAVSGAGYAVRGMTGLALAVDLGDRPGAALAAGLAMWASGVVFVTCRWALEALCLCTLVDGRLHWAVTAEQAREHTVGLVRWLPQQVPGPPRAWRALAGHTPLAAPWHLALAVASAAALVAGALLAEPVDAPGALLLVASGAGSAVLAAVSPDRRVTAPILWMLVLLTLSAASVQHVVVASLPWLVVHLLHLSSSTQCADDIGRPLHRLRGSVGR